MSKPVVLPSSISPKSLAFAGLFVVMALLLWPDSSHEPSLAEIAGHRVAKRLPSLRRENAERLRELEAAKQATDLQLGQSRKTIAVLSRDILDFSNPTDSTSSVSTTATLVGDTPVLGPVIAGDTLIPLRVIRLRVEEFTLQIQRELSDIQAVLMIERGRAALAIASHQNVIMSQDTIITGLRSELGRKVKPWYKRASRGVVAMGAGVGCGSATYVLAGPLAAVGGAVLCSAIAGVR